MNFTNFQTILIVCLISLTTYAQQTITGDFSPLAGQEVRLVAFDGFGIHTIDSTKVSEQGVFKLNYKTKESGMAYLAAADNKPYFVVLANEDIDLKGDVLNVPAGISTLSGKENKLFVQYALEHPKREQALSAWVYLQNIYQADPFFSQHEYTKQAIVKEMQRIKQEDTDFLKNLDSNSYVHWYLPTRKLVSSVSTVAQYRTEAIPATLSAFRKLDHTDTRLYKSGLLKDVIESHFWLLENMGQPLDTVYKEMSISIDFMLDNLSKDEEKFNEITKYLFDLLERQSLLQASEYLAIKVLTQNTCTINDDFAKQLESYRAMKKGNTAPDIIFCVDVLKNGSPIKTPNRLSDLQSAYKVVIFGASWCPKCTEEVSQLLPLYEKWKSKGVEVVFVSLDTDQAVFKGFSSVFPFISMCDYTKWENQTAKDYYVFATPTMFLLDTDHKILLRPNSVKQIDAWVDYVLTDEKSEKN